MEAIQQGQMTSPSDLWDFYTRLVDDPVFRARLEAEPAAVFRDYRICFPGESLAQEVRLPPREAIAKALRRATVGRRFVMGAEEWAKGTCLTFAWFAFLLPVWRPWSSPSDVTRNPPRDTPRDGNNRSCA